MTPASDPSVPRGRHPPGSAPEVHPTGGPRARAFSMSERALGFLLRSTCWARSEAQGPPDWRRSLCSVLGTVRRQEGSLPSRRGTGPCPTHTRAWAARVLVGVPPKQSLRGGLRVHPASLEDSLETSLGEGMGSGQPRARFHERGRGSRDSGPRYPAHTVTSAQPKGQRIGVLLC